MSAVPEGARVVRLKRRREFLAVAAGGRRWDAPAFSLQAAARPGDGDGVSGVGFTVTKRIGDAVTRNRARRRLREAARLELCISARPGPARPGVDYVVVARGGALRQPFAELRRDLARAFARAPDAKPRPRGGRGRR